jgi:5-formyltetrahydrofolate cyclo-ligase
MVGPSAFPASDRRFLTSTDPDLEARKAALRSRLKARRAEAFAANGSAIAALAAERFKTAIPLPPGQVVAGYWPMGDELDPLPLLRALQRQGLRIVLPAVQKGSRLLEFRICDDLANPPPGGAYGIPAPDARAPALRPDVLLVPLVGFDTAGHRLGMGGGYYDATLAALREKGEKSVAVGYAFAVQQVAELPRGDHDMVLDWAVTERAAIKFERQ